jgi:NitT/TauT family transport system substrate-binding protein
VTILPGGPDIDPSQVLASGKADVAIDWMPSALAARDKGAAIVNIAQIFQRSGLELTCRRDSGIRRPADFKGKTIAVWFAGNEYPFLAWMAKLGFTTSGATPDITVLRQGAGVELLVKKEAACISTMTYNEYGQLLDAGMQPSQLIVFRYEDQGVAVLEDGLYTAQGALADPAMVDRLARFLRGSPAGSMRWRRRIRPRPSCSCCATLRPARSIGTISSGCCARSRICYRKAGMAWAISTRPPISAPPMCCSPPRSIR